MSKKLFLWSLVLLFGALGRASAICPMIVGPSHLCVGDAATYSNSFPGGTWRATGTGGMLITSLGGAANAISAGVVTVSYIAGCGTVTMTVTIDAPPTAIIGPPSVCQGVPTSFSDLTIGGAWSCTPTSMASIDASGNFTGHIPGLATITYTMPSGCFVTTTVSITPAPTISGTLTVCEGQTTTLSSTPGTWMPGSGPIGTVGLTTGVVTGISAGTVDITFTETSTGCPAVATVTVNALPVATASSNSPVCPSSGVLNLYGGPGGMSSYAWTGPGTYTSAVQNPTGATYPTTAGTYAYSLVVIDANGCVSLPATTYVVVGLPLDITVSETYPTSVSGDHIYTYCAGTAGYMTLAASGAFTGSYSWNTGTGLSCTACSSPNVTTTISRTYTVSGSYNGCTGSTTVNVFVPAAGTCSPCDYFKVTQSCAAATCTGCSDLQPFHTINSSSVAGSSLSSGVNYYIAQSMSVTGTATVSNDVFFMKNGISLIVPPTADLTLDHCHLWGCTWSGTSVKVNSTDAGKLTLTGGTLVENAASGVTVNSGSYSTPTASVPASGNIIGSDDAILNNNSTGMSITYWPASTAVTSTTLPFAIENTVFCGRDFTCYSAGSSVSDQYPFSWPTTSDLKLQTSSDDYNPAFGIDAYTPTGSASRGMTLEGTYTYTSGSSNTYYSIVVGNGAGGQNMFDKLADYGVYCLNGANMIFVNNLFRNITGYTSQGIKANRNASYNVNYLLKLTNDGSSSYGSGNIFYNCGSWGGVPNVSSSEYYHTEARYTTMTSVNDMSTGVIVTYGLSVSSANFDLMELTHNKISNVRHAIYVGTTENSGVASYGDIKVNDNILSSSYWDGTGSAPTYDNVHYMTLGITVTDHRTFGSGHSYAIGGTIDISNNKINQIVGTSNTVGTGIGQMSYRDYPSTISGNTVSMNYHSGNAGAKGIYSFANVYSQVTDNVVSGPGFNTPTGVYAGSNVTYGNPITAYFIVGVGHSTNSADFEISCNRATDVNFAFFYWATNYVNWKNNTMYKSKYGLYIYDRITQQGSLGNPSDNLWQDDGSGTWWAGPGCTTGIWQTWLASAGSSVNSPLYVRPNPGSTPDYTPTNNGPGTACGYPGGVRYSFSSSSLVDASAGGSYTLTAASDCSSGGGGGKPGAHAQGGNINVGDGSVVYAVYPNPSNGSISISRSGDMGTTESVKVFNAIGQVVYEHTLEFNADVAQISLSSKVPAGLYLVDITNGKGQRHVERIEVRK